MGKKIIPLSEDLEKMVKDLAVEMGLKANGINIEPVGMPKSRKEVTKVSKINDQAEWATNDSSMVFVYLYEEAFNRVDDQTKEMWIRSALSQIYYDNEKGKIMVVKPELNIPLGMYHRFGNIAAQNAEVAIHTIQQILQEEKDRKEAKKMEKKNKK